MRQPKLSNLGSKIIMLVLLAYTIACPSSSNAFVENLTVIGVENTDDKTIIKFEVINRNPSSDDIFFFGNGKSITRGKNGIPLIDPQFHYQPYLVDDHENKYNAEGDFVSGDITKYFYDPYEGYYGGDSTYKYKLPPMAKSQGQFLFPKVQNSRHVRMVIPGIAGWTQDMFVNNLLLPGEVEVAEEVKREERQPSREVPFIEPDPATDEVRIKAKPSGIHKVDFKNLSYTLNACNEFFKIGKKAKLKNGKYKNNNGEVEIGKILYGDLTGDGIEGAVVTLNCEPTHNNNAFGSEIHMFKVSKGKPVEIGTLGENKIQEDYRKNFPNGVIWSCGIDSVDGSGIYIKAATDGPHCCPQHTVTFHYKYGKNTFYLSELPTVEPFK